MPMTQPARRRRRARGFTLLELMTVVVVVAILAAIAYPSYRSYVIRAHRTDATRALMDASARMEQYFSQKQSYTGATRGSAATDVVPATSPDGFYALKLSVTPNGTAYTIEATPTDSQAHDTACGTFQYDQRGTRTVTGTSSASDCWRTN